MENDVLKVLDEDGYLTMILKDDNGFWTWTVSDYDIKDYLTKYHPAFSGGYKSKKTLSLFANDPINSIKGTSCGSYKSIDDILKEYGKGEIK